MEAHDANKVTHIKRNIRNGIDWNDAHSVELNAKTKQNMVLELANMQSENFVCDG